MNGIEIQLRTALQHQWAEVSEKLSDTIDPNIKYGGGNASVRKTLDGTSNLNASIESTERSLDQLRIQVKELEQLQFKLEQHQVKGWNSLKSRN